MIEAMLAPVDNLFYAASQVGRVSRYARLIRHALYFKPAAGIFDYPAAEVSTACADGPGYQRAAPPSGVGSFFQNFFIQW